MLCVFKCSDHFQVCVDTCTNGYSGVGSLSPSIRMTDSMSLNDAEAANVRMGHGDGLCTTFQFTLYFELILFYLTCI